MFNVEHHQQWYTGPVKQKEHLLHLCLYFHLVVQIQDHCTFSRYRFYCFIQKYKSKTLYQFLSAWLWHKCFCFLCAVVQPDIAAPGVNILAAFTPMRSLTGLKGDTQFSDFTIMSGTSMACPHIAGVAAYVKSFHPDWSPAAIKSAILTTGNN